QDRYRHPPVRRPLVSCGHHKSPSNRPRSILNSYLAQFLGGRAFTFAVAPICGYIRIMRWRGLAVLSLGLNMLLALAWLVAIGGSRSPTVASGPQGPGGPTAVRTNTVVRRQFFTWQEVESPDYPTYIANLRDIGCPEQTIRDIIIADVNALYARRRATEV